MAEDSIGFDTNSGVSESQFANLSYHLGSLFPTVNTDGTHTVRAGTAAMTVDITNGISAAFGVRHNITTTTNLPITAVTLAGATRWDAIVKRFDWSNNSAVIMKVEGTAAVNAPKVTPGGVLANPGVQYDQVLALVKATNGSTALEIADRRIWGSKQFTVATVDALPTITSAHKGATFYVSATDATYRYSAAGWVSQAAPVTELTGANVIVTATANNWTAGDPLVNRCLILPYQRQIDIEVRKTAGDLNANNDTGNIGDSVIGTLTDPCKPDRPIPVPVIYRGSGDVEYGGMARLDPNGTLTLLSLSPLANLLASSVVGYVSLRASINFGRKTA